MVKWYDEMHEENTRVFLALVYSFLGVKAEEVNEADATVLAGVRLGRELTPEEIVRLPEDVQEILRAHGGKVRCHLVEV